MEPRLTSRVMESEEDLIFLIIISNRILINSEKMQDLIRTNLKLRWVVEMCNHIPLSISLRNSSLDRWNRAERCKRRGFIQLIIGRKGLVPRSKANSLLNLMRAVLIFIITIWQLGTRVDAGKKERNRKMEVLYSIRPKLNWMSLAR